MLCGAYLEAVAGVINGYRWIALIDIMDHFQLIFIPKIEGVSVCLSALYRPENYRIDFDAATPELKLQYPGGFLPARNF